MYMRQWNKMLLIAAVVSIAAVIASGCGHKSANSNGGVKTQSYKADGYLGMTNSHPQLPGHHIVTDLSTDNVSMREAIKNLRGVADSNVIFNGADAYVTIKLKPGLQAREIPTLEQQAATVLRFNYPRYTIHVTSIK